MEAKWTAFRRRRAGCPSPSSQGAQFSWAWYSGSPHGIPLRDSAGFSPVFPTRRTNSAYNGESGCQWAGGPQRVRSGKGLHATVGVRAPC